MSAQPAPVALVPDKGDALVVEVIESSADEEGRVVFDCRIHRAGHVIASGTLTAFQPADNSFV